MKPVPERRSAQRLICIDALRGAAALGVVLFHTTGNAPWTAPGFHAYSPANWLLVLNCFGFTGVYLFFVISGFCIHLRWARANVAQPGSTLDFGSFWRRRFQRLYPTYLIALVLYLAARGVDHKLDLSAWGLTDIVVHLLMLHNVDERTRWSICGVFWTLAVEEQLYLAYFLLLRLRGALGWLRTLGVCLAVRGAWMVLHAVLAGVVAGRLNIYLALDEAAAMHWFTWALGAVGIEHVTGLAKLPPWCRDLRLAAVTVGLAAGFSLLLKNYGASQQHVPLPLTFLVEPLWGLGFFVLVLGLTDAERGWKQRGRVPVWVPGFAWLGVISYSLYCTHTLVLLSGSALIHANERPFRMMLLVPAAVAFAWLFYRVAEKPFIPAPAAH